MPSLRRHIDFKSLKPSLTCSSEVWGAFVQSDFKSWDNSSIKKAHLQFSQKLINNSQTQQPITSTTSFPGSFILGKKDPGSGWSRASQKVGGDKKNAGGRSKQVAILSFLNSLWKGQICLKM